MISGKTIICFASGWDYHPTSKHHVMRHLSACNHIIWVNWHASRRPSADLADLRTICSKLRQIRQGPRRVADTITVITPAQLPLPGSRTARRLNTELVRHAIDKVRRSMTGPTQIWSFAPDVGDLIGAFDEELVLYYCVDAFGAFPGYDRAVTEQRERELLARSDVVITTSPPLYEAHSSGHTNVHLVEHGVDHAHLSRAVREQLPQPSDLAGLPRPILGFVGIIGEWVDLDLLAELAQLRRDASIVLIGPELSGRGPCSSLANVHWLGPRPHAELPRYLRSFDVGLIPFRHTPLAHHANPIKLYEYLAAGVPVVSTSIPSVRPVPGSVWLADEATGMAVACGRAMRHNNESSRRERSNGMREHAWRHRIEKLSAIVSDTLERKSNRNRQGAEDTWANSGAIATCCGN